MVIIKLILILSILFTFADSNTETLVWVRQGILEKAVINFLSKEELESDQKSTNFDHLQLKLMEKLRIVKCVITNEHLTSKECENRTKPNLQQFRHKKFIGMLG